MSKTVGLPVGIAALKMLKGKIKSHVQPDYADIKHEYYDPEQMKCVELYF